MEDKNRCQSCGMPLGEGFHGTNSDQSANNDYCKLCYRNGKFIQPELTVHDMIKLSINNMTTELHFPLEKAEDLANSVIPRLRRWR